MSSDDGTAKTVRYSDSGVTVPSSADEADVGERLGAGDGPALSGERTVALRNAKAAEVLVFDLA